MPPEARTHMRRSDLFGRHEIVHSLHYDLRREKVPEVLSYNRLCVANRDELDTINATHRNAYS